MSAGSLSPLPDDPKPKIESDTGPTRNGKRASSVASGSNGTLTPISVASPSKPQSNDDEDDERKPDNNKVKMEEHKRLYAEEEKKVRDLEPPPAERLQDE